MAYLPGFAYDVFISYSHVDNQGRSPWVTGFEEALGFALAQKLGRIEVKIWRDTNIDGGQVFNETISTAIRSSALFIALNSNGYLRSEYCRQELRSFRDKAAAEPYGLQVSDRSRIYNVLLTAIPHTEWLPELPRTTGYPLHDDSPELAEPTDPLLDAPRYKQQLKALADSLFKMLQAFKNRIDETRTEPPAVVDPAAGGQRVFVADVADSLTAARKRLVTELQRKGITVEASAPPPWDGPAHDHRVVDVTRDVALSIHLLDVLPGREIEGSQGTSYPQRQVDLLRASKRTQLIWVPKTLDIAAVEDERHKSFLQQLETGIRDGAKYNFVRGSTATLTPEILEHLEALKAPPSPDFAQAVLVDTHVKDQRYALEIGQLLLESRVQPFINPQEDDPTKNLDVLEARLAQVSCLAIVYGAVSESWVRQRLGVALQLSVTKNLPLKSFAVVLVPPEKPGAVRFSLGPVSVGLIDNSKSAKVSLSLLAPLLAASSPTPA
jgi:hypothetical protein